jgi:putative intracellular protease/amidase
VYTCYSITNSLYWIRKFVKSNDLNKGESNQIVDGPFKAHAVCDGHLVTGQQQYSGAAAAKLVIEALGG